MKFDAGQNSATNLSQNPQQQARYC